MGIAPNVWGPSAWTFIHLMVLSEKEPFERERLTYYQQFFTVLTHVLPCEKCRLHLKENLTKLKSLDAIQSKEELFNWSVDLHNLVNKITNKRTWSYEEANIHWNAIISGQYIPDHKGVHDIENIPKKQILIGIIIVTIIAIIAGITMKVLRKSRRRS
jgi:hypothetical protein